MARKGLMYVCAGKMHVGSDGAVTYHSGKYFGESSTLTGSVSKSDSKDYGDSRLCEKDSSVNSVSLSWELNSDQDDIYTYLLGHSMNESEELEFSGDDQAEHVGVACVGAEGSGYLGLFYMDTQFSEPDDSYTTRKESTEFGHVTLAGEAFLDEKGKYKTRKRFKTKAEAIAWAKEKTGFGVKDPAAEAAGQADEQTA